MGVYLYVKIDGKTLLHAEALISCERSLFWGWGHCVKEAVATILWQAIFHYLSFFFPLCSRTSPCRTSAKPCRKDVATWWSACKDWQQPTLLPSGWACRWHRSSARAQAEHEPFPEDCGCFGFFRIKSSFKTISEKPLGHAQPRPPPAAQFPGPSALSCKNLQRFSTFKIGWGQRHARTWK